MECVCTPLIHLETCGFGIHLWTYELLIFSALSHPNVRITSDHGENVLINRLEVQNAIWANELSVKRRALNKQQCIMRLPLTSHSTYWKLVSYTSHLDPHFISTFHLDTQER
eukprot:920501_1